MAQSGVDGVLRAVPSWPLPDPEEAFGDSARPRPRGYLRPGSEREQAKRPRPGRYLDLHNDQVVDLTTAGEVEAQAERLAPDSFGFVRLRVEEAA